MMFFFSFTLVFSLVKRICDLFRKLRGFHVPQLDLVELLIDKRDLILTVLYSSSTFGKCLF